MVHFYFLSAAVGVDLGSNIFGKVSPKCIRALVSLMNERIDKVFVDLILHFVFEIAIVRIIF